MTNDERDAILIETRTDIRWIKEYIKDQKKYRYGIFIVFVMAILGIIV